MLSKPQWHWCSEHHSLFLKFEQTKLFSLNCHLELNYHILTENATTVLIYKIFPLLFLIWRTNFVYPCPFVPNYISLKRIFAEIETPMGAWVYLTNLYLFCSSDTSDKSVHVSLFCFLVIASSTSTTSASNLKFCHNILVALRAHFHFHHSWCPILICSAAHRWHILRKQELAYCFNNASFALLFALLIAPSAQKLSFCTSAYFHFSRSDSDLKSFFSVLIFQEHFYSYSRALCLKLFWQNLIAEFCVFRFSVD